MIKRKPGRPHKIDPNRKQITIDQAVELTQKYWAKFEMSGYSKKSIYNMSSAGKLEKERKGKCVLLFEDDVIRKLCG